MISPKSELVSEMTKLKHESEHRKTFKQKQANTFKFSAEEASPYNSIEPEVKYSS